MKKILISVFIVLNLITVLFTHRPRPLADAFNRWSYSHLSPLQSWKLNMIGWHISNYGHHIGLDNRWEMFSFAHRFHWWYLFRAESDGNKVIDLPLPLQSNRSFIQKYFFDFREAKYHLNLYANKTERLAYMSYLCRRFSVIEGAKTRKIILELHHQIFNEREVTRATGQYMNPNAYSRALDEITCAT